MLVESKNHTAIIQDFCHFLHRQFSRCPIRPTKCTFSHLRSIWNFSSQTNLLCTDTSYILNLSFGPMLQSLYLLQCSVPTAQDHCKIGGILYIFLGIEHICQEKLARYKYFTVEKLCGIIATRGNLYTTLSYAKPQYTSPRGWAKQETRIWFISGTSWLNSCYFSCLFSCSSFCTLFVLILLQVQCVFIRKNCLHFWDILY